MKSGVKKNLKIVGIWIFGFFVVLLVITAFDLVLKKYFNMNVNSLFGWLIDLPIAFLVWRIFFKWIDEIKKNYFFETHKEK